MTMQVDAGEAWLDRLTWAVTEGERPVAQISMLKNFATDAMEFCANEAMQIFGGAGYLRGAKVERIYRDAKPFAIGGGSVEIMKDLAARQLGL
jgi:acyl-CoA dehydrogenase